MKLIIILYIIITLNVISSAPVDRPRCITTDNIYEPFGTKYTKPLNGEVDWWFLNQLIEQDAIYTDSNLHGSETILEIFGYKTRKNPESPLYNTYIQSNITSKYHSITYNDQKINKKEFKDDIMKLQGKDGKKNINLDGSAHSKGFFIWNENGGIHVIHSFPEAPISDNSRFVPNSGKQLSQHAMCIELTVDELKIIPKYLIYSNSNLQTIDNQRLKCWKNKLTNKCSVSLSLIKGEFIDKSKTQHEVNKITNYDFIGKFDTAKQTKLKEIKTFEVMETFINDNIFNNNNWMKDNIEIGKWSEIASKIAGSYITSANEIIDPLNGNNVHYFNPLDASNGKYFLQTSNGHLRTNYLGKKSEDILKQSKYEILWRYIRKHPSYSDVTNWISHTMTKETGGDDNWFKSGDKIDLAYKFQTQTIQIDEKTTRTSLREISTSDDHSKLLYGSSTDNKYNVFCVGDLNWQGVQALRGGGALCRTDLGYLVHFFTRRVPWLRSRDSDDEPNKFGILNSLFTVRSTTNLDWIENGLIKEYKLDGKNLNEITPNSNVKASFFLTGYQSMLKLTVTRPTDYTETTKESKVETELFKLNVYPSIPEKVFICQTGSTKCNFESSIKILILKDIKLPVSYVIPNLENTYFSKNNMDVTIKVGPPETTLNWESKELLLDLYTSSKIAKTYVDDVLPATESISLIRDDKKDNVISKFKFPLSTNPIDQICNGNVGTRSIVFNEECHDLLYLCLYHDQPIFVSLLPKSKADVITFLKDQLKINFADKVKTCLKTENDEVVKDSKGEPSYDEKQRIARNERAARRAKK